MWGKRESLTANDNDLISVSLKIIRAPFSGRGRRAKRGGVGFPECGSTVSRGQPPPLRGTSFQRKEGEKRAACIVIGLFAAKWAPSLLYPLPLNPPPPFLFQRKAERRAAHVGGGARVPDRE